MIKTLIKCIIVFNCSLLKTLWWWEFDHCTTKYNSIFRIKIKKAIPSFFVREILAVNDIHSYFLQLLFWVYLKKYYYIWKRKWNRSVSDQWWQFIKVDFVLYLFMLELNLDRKIRGLISYPAIHILYIKVMLRFSCAILLVLSRFVIKIDP